MEKAPLLSILIPTKNRQEFTIQVINNILKTKDDRFELIIQDNSETDKLGDLISNQLKDSRLKYFYTSEVLSFVANFSSGITECRGEYITIIGDDDSLNPVIFDVVAWASKKGIEAITPALSLVYFWPNSGVSAINENGRLSITEFTSEVKFIDPAREVLKLLKNGCQNYLSYNLAKVYHGIIKRSVLLNIKDRTGKYIGGLSPDIYLSIAASLLVKKVLIIDYPLTISGICNQSGSADSATGKHTGKLENAPHFRGHANYEWSTKVPPFYSVETIWGDSALSPLKDLKQYKLMSYFNIDVISAFCMNSYPQYNNEIINNLAKNLKLSKKSFLITHNILNGYLKGPIITKVRAIKNQIFNKKNSKIFNNIQDIDKATEIVHENIALKNNLILKKLNQIQ